MDMPRGIFSVVSTLVMLGAVQAGAAESRLLESSHMRLAMEGEEGMQAPSPMPGGSQGGPGSNCPGCGGMQKGPDEMGGMMDDGMGMQDAQKGGMGRMGPTDRIEGRIAFLRTEVKIKDAQALAWNQFAEALRTSRKHLIEARQSHTSGGSPSARLESYEWHLQARLEALKAVRAAYAQLYNVLDDSQKHTAEELIVPYIATF